MDPLILTLATVLFGAAVVAGITGLVANRRRRRRSAQSLRAIDFVRSAFFDRLRGPEPLGDLLRTMVEALRDSFNLDRAEVWIARDAALRLLVAEPPREAAPVPIAPAEESIFANARVSGFAWAKTWLPQLIPDPGVGFRIAPVANQGNLLGLIIIERRKGATTLAMETDQTLEESIRPSSARKASGRPSKRLADARQFRQRLRRTASGATHPGWKRPCTSPASKRFRTRQSMPAQMRRSR